MHKQTKTVKLKYKHTLSLYILGEDGNCTALDGIPGADGINGRDGQPGLPVSN